jgi:hypothetical protein
MVGFKNLTRTSLIMACLIAWSIAVWLWMDALQQADAETAHMSREGMGGRLFWISTGGMTLLVLEEAVPLVFCRERALPVVGAGGDRDI